MRTAALGAAVVFQLFVLTGMVIYAAMPLWIGKEIRVNVSPVDPRSLFRGDYARLTYEFSRLPDDFLKDKEARAGEVVYVLLKQDSSGVYSLAGASMDKPSGEIFLRGRLTGECCPHRAFFGIEAFFAPAEKAALYERNLRGGGEAVLMVTPGGRAALKNLTAERAQHQ